MTAPLPRVLLVGAGALGSHVALLLRNHASLVIVDFDRLESKNLLSQFHTKVATGRNKANSLQGLLAMTFGTQAMAVVSKLTVENAQAVASAAKVSLVIDCTDNAAARRAAQKAADETMVECLHAGLAAGGTYGAVLWGEDFRADDPPTGAATCDDGEHLPWIAAVASITAFAAQKWLKNRERPGFYVDGTLAIVKR